MDTIYWHMNGSQGGANLHPGVNLHSRAICIRVQIAHMKTALEANLCAYTLFEHCNYHYQKSQKLPN